MTTPQTTDTHPRPTLAELAVVAAGVRAMDRRAAAFEHGQKVIRLAADATEEIIGEDGALTLAWTSVPRERSGRFDREYATAEFEGAPAGAFLRWLPAHEYDEPDAGLFLVRRCEHCGAERADEITELADLAELLTDAPAPRTPGRGSES